MADIRNQRPRPGVRIYLHPNDIANIVMQKDVLETLSSDELEQVLFSVELEMKLRKPKEIEDANS